MTAVSKGQSCQREESKQIWIKKRDRRSRETEEIILPEVKGRESFRRAVMQKEMLLKFEKERERGGGGEEEEKEKEGREGGSERGRRKGREAGRLQRSHVG